MKNFVIPTDVKSYSRANTVKLFAKWLGLTLLIVGLIISLIGILKWYIILVIAIGAIAVAFLLLLLLKSGDLRVKRTDEETGYRPYSEVMKDKKAQNAIDDSEPMPTLKDYSNTKKK